MMDQAWISSHGYPNYDLLHDPSSLQALITGHYPTSNTNPNPNPNHAFNNNYMMNDSVEDHLEASTSLAFNTNYSSVFQDIQKTNYNNNNNSNKINPVLLPNPANYTNPNTNADINNNNVSSAISERISPSTYRTQLQRESHILAERQRREEMNDKFTILRSMIPKLTKKDKASIVNDTINYIKELEKKVAYLRACKGKMKGLQTPITKTRTEDGPLKGSQVSNCVLLSQTKTTMQVENNQLNKHKEYPRRINRGQVEIEELGSQAVIKVISSRSRGIALRIHLTLEDYKVDVIQSNVTTLGNNMVHFITIELKSNLMIDMDALATSLQSAIMIPTNEA